MFNLFKKSNVVPEQPEDLYQAFANLEFIIAGQCKSLSLEKKLAIRKFYIQNGGVPSEQLREVGFTNGGVPDVDHTWYLYKLIEFYIIESPIRVMPTDKLKYIMSCCAIFKSDVNAVINTVNRVSQSLHKNGHKTYQSFLQPITA